MERLWMEHHPLIALFDAFANERLVLLYGGSFPDEHTARLIGLGEAAMDHQGVEKSLRTRTAFVMVEAYQNVVRHQPTSVKGLQSTFMFMHGPERTEVVTVNPVRAEDLPALQTALERIEGRGPIELKALFLASLQRNEPTKRGGAGLGLIEMARRSAQGVNHSFWQEPGGWMRFALRVRTVGNDEDNLHEARLRDLDKWVTENGCILLCYGTPSATIQETLLRMVGAESDRGGDVLERAGMAAMELVTALQPLHGAALLAWCDTPMERSVHLVVPFPSQRDNGLWTVANELSTASSGEVHRRYRDALLGRTPDHGPGVTGLLDLARRSTEPIRIEQVTGHGRNLMLISARL